MPVFGGTTKIGLGESPAFPGFRPLSEEATRRLGESALIKRKDFATQGRAFGPVTAAGFAEGQLRAEAEAKTQQDYRNQQLVLEKQRIDEAQRQFDIQERADRRAKQADENRIKLASIAKLAALAASAVKSDRRLKENIEPLLDTLKKVRKLRGVRFDWKHGRKDQIGVIAQEIEEVLPEAVNTCGDGYKEVNFQMLVGFLIDAVNRQQEEIDIIKEYIVADVV